MHQYIPLVLKDIEMQASDDEYSLRPIMKHRGIGLGFITSENLSIGEEDNEDDKEDEDREELRMKMVK